MWIFNHLAVLFTICSTSVDKSSLASSFVRHSSWVFRRRAKNFLCSLRWVMTLGIWYCSNKVSSAWKWASTASMICPSSSTHLGDSFNASTAAWSSWCCLSISGIFMVGKCSAIADCALPLRKEMERLELRGPNMQQLSFWFGCCLHGWNPAYLKRRNFFTLHGNYPMNYIDFNSQYFSL